MTEELVEGAPNSSSTVRITPEISIHEVTERALNAWNRHDMRAFAALFREDAVFVNEDGHRWVTRPQIELELSARHESLFRASRSSAVETEMSFLAPTVAALQVRWELVRLISPNGSSLPHRSGSCYSFSQLMLMFGGSPWAKILPAALSVVEGTLCPVATDGGALLEPEHRWLCVDVLASGQTPSGVP